MTERKFKVGDRVVVRDGFTNRVTHVTTVEKFNAHGNFTVKAIKGKQFRPSGWATGSGYRHDRVHHLTDAVILEIHRNRLRNQLQKAWDDFEKDCASMDESKQPSLGKLRQVLTALEVSASEKDTKLEEARAQEIERLRFAKEG